MEFSYVDVENSMLPDQEALPTAPAKPRAKRACQVPGCTADLDAIGKPYCCLKRICPEHMKADAIPVYGQIMRYCQQCGTLEPLTMFQSNKRSCKGSLARRSKRPAQQERRKRRAAGSFGPSSSNETSSISWGAAAFPAAAADAAAGTATGVCGDVLDMDPNWGSSMMDGASVLPCSDIWGATAVTAAASWGGNWLEQPAAAATALEQVMLQELAAAGVLAMDSSSAARLPLPPAAFTAPAQQQLDSASMDTKHK
ncbi:SBP domain-containing protein [Scenedesmus sp. NREL 46B-D3]|nr:SBP domain-containing protein [Scenedesmus sp. NREL 46B-D3]